MPTSTLWPQPFLVRYQLAVTRRKEEESWSSSIYFQNDIWTPTMTFTDFINNETLLGEVGSSGDGGGAPMGLASWLPSLGP